MENIAFFREKTSIFGEKRNFGGETTSFVGKKSRSKKVGLQWDGEGAQACRG